MNRAIIQALLIISLCPLLLAQQPTQSASPATTAKLVSAEQPPVNVPQASPVTDHNQILKNARTICIRSETAFLTVSTLERALMKQKNWDRLGVNIVGETCKADLEIDVDRLIFTHIHTYVLTDKKTGIVLASGRVTAFDGIVASGPMAEQIVKILSAARLPAQAAGAASGL
jgi:hypothetical protein